MIILYIILTFLGELAQLARASALQAEGQGFEPPILHKRLKTIVFSLFFCLNYLVCHLLFIYITVTKIQIYK